jgi:hypothetical protein
MVAGASSGDAFTICSTMFINHLAQILGIEPRRQLGRTDQIAEHHQKLSPFSVSARRGIARCRGHSSGGPLGPERGNGIEPPPPMPHQREPGVLQILDGQAMRHSGIDRVRADAGSYFSRPRPLKPCRNVHARLLDAVTATPVNRTPNSGRVRMLHVLVAAKVMRCIRGYRIRLPALLVHERYYVL